MNHCTFPDIDGALVVILPENSINVSVVKGFFLCPGSPHAFSPWVLRARELFEEPFKRIPKASGCCRGRFVFGGDGSRALPEIFRLDAAALDRCG